MSYKDRTEWDRVCAEVKAVLEIEERCEWLEERTSKIGKNIEEGRCN